jgi:hypothetical protein
MIQVTTGATWRSTWKSECFRKQLLKSKILYMLRSRFKLEFLDSLDSLVSKILTKEQIPAQDESVPC